jgi:GDPmannose 4,6-dehydratase
VPNASALILGGSGQDGAFLAEHLLRAGSNVTSMSSKLSDRMSSLGISQIEREINPDSGISDILREIRPTIVINLVSLSSVAYCEENQAKSLAINSELVFKLSTEIRDHSESFASPVRFIQASSSEMFGTGSHVCSETTKLNPITTYGIHKRDAHEFLMRTSTDLATNISVILFNHESEFRPANFVSAKVARAAAEVAVSGFTEIEFGNLESKRDWGFAGDYMRAVTDICLNAKHQCYVIASGELHSIREMLETAFKYVGIENFEEHIKLNSKYLRRIETPPIVGDSGLYKSEFGDKATLSFSQTIGRMVQHYLDKMKGNHNV